MEQVPLFAGGDLGETTPEEAEALRGYVSGLNDFIIDEMEHEVVPHVVEKFYDPSPIDPYEEVELTLPVWKMGTAYFILRNHAADAQNENGMIGRSMASLTADEIQETGSIEDYAIDISDLSFSTRNDSNGFM